MDKQQKPELTLLPGKKVLDMESITNLFRKLTGKEPTPQDLAESQKILDAHNEKK